jgi:hypothetical protein
VVRSTRTPRRAATPKLDWSKAEVDRPPALTEIHNFKVLELAAATLDYVAPKSPQVWIVDTFKRIKKAGKLPTGRGAPTRLVKWLLQAQHIAVLDGSCTGHSSRGGIENILRKQGFPPPKSRN